VALGIPMGSVYEVQEAPGSGSWNRTEPSKTTRQGVMTGEMADEALPINQRLVGDDQQPLAAVHSCRQQSARRAISLAFPRGLRYTRPRNDSAMFRRFLPELPCRVPESTKIRHRLFGTHASQDSD
jgi:hypothetical protein